MVQSTPVNIMWGTMVIIDNLKYDVLEDDLKDLMEAIGPVESIKISYDSSGRSEGKASVVFRAKYDAEQAVKEYHGVEIDGQKMVIEIGSKVKIMVTKEPSSWRDRGNFKSGRRSSTKEERGRDDRPFKEDRRRDDTKPLDRNKSNDTRKEDRTRPRDSNNPPRDRKEDRTRQNNPPRDYAARDNNNRAREDKPARDETQNQGRENY